MQDSFHVESAWYVLSFFIIVVLFFFVLFCSFNYYSYFCSVKYKDRCYDSTSKENIRNSNGSVC